MIYAGSICVTKKKAEESPAADGTNRIKVGHALMFLTADDDIRAREMLGDYAADKWPQTDGWNDPDIHLSVIPGQHPLEAVS